VRVADCAFFQLYTSKIVGAESALRVNENVTADL
jgi:hypothetical protein